MTDRPGAQRQLMMGPADWGLLFLLSALWGGSFFFIAIAVREVPTLTIVTLRVGLAAAVLWGIVLVTGRRLPRSSGVWAAFLGMGVLNNVIPFGLIVYGQQSIASSLASILNATTPIFGIVVAGALLADERITRPKLLAVGLGIAGVIIMVGPRALGDLGSDLLPQLACLGGALFYALAGAYGRRFGRLGIDPVTVAAGQVSGATLVLLPLALTIDGPGALALPGGASWAAIGALAVASTAFAYILYFALLQRVGASNLLLVTFLVPVWAICLGLLLLGEALSRQQVAGMMLIGAGLLAIDGRLWSALMLRRTRSGG